MLTAPTTAGRATAVSRTVVLARATWKRYSSGSLIVEKGTWCAHKGTNAAGSVIVPMVCCPNCGQVTYLAHSDAAVDELARLGIRLKSGPIPVRHQIDRLGKVVSLERSGPAFLCGHGRCDFHRPIYLDRWQDEKPLWVVAFTAPGSTDAEFLYCHATNAQEARYHFGPAKGRAIVGVGPAVGYFTDERNGRQFA